MNTDYCSSCGGKIEYLMKVPNFCPCCGISTGNSTLPPQTAVARRSSFPSRGNASTSQSITEDPEGTDINHVPQLRGLQYEIESDYSPIAGRKVPLSQIIGTEPVHDSPKANIVPKKKKRGRPRKKVAPSLEQKFSAVKQTLEDCKSSSDKIVDVGEE
jgi:hypothetical protein